ncbi:hypothetical protein [Alicyclobacillus acidoterrestris]|uniref:Uncharacterized protein n=1 Tax=Alicyclobacillus acidoterrestris (strain ATCC 49025 / DSM 3922 / CIP 106132 / NCIMB 13137 / GD3B) TaxID=1356854 RepID=T0BEV5_ALIAG|nr:hypothetical protein [Alicyclobacillus acidoterrestris]EPZ42513.1 hypothetical protein N007_01665 [Alicyclobacillus acidoterrestris ATCC 49025]UNO49473.1 hypothetical protein K1I37_02670 [Alicyclobacillus acidoterrestris]
MEKFILSFVSLGLLLLAGFALMILEHGMAKGVGGLMMLLAMISAAGIDIRLRSPNLRKYR